MVWHHKIEATIHAVYHSGKSWFFGSQKVEKVGLLGLKIEKTWFLGIANSVSTFM